MSKDSSKAPKGGSVPIPKMNRGVKGFYRDVVREMKHVNWPTRKETTRLTGVVLGVCGLIIVYLFAASKAFETIIGIVLGGGN
jgi:preprotein translocase subunit SecE